MTSEAVAEEQETAEEVVEEIVEKTEEVEQQEDEQEVQEEKKEEFVPVATHVAERKRRQEAEQKAQWLEQQMQQAQQPQKQQVDNSDDLLTVGQQQQTLQEFKRSILEEAYLEQNPDMIDKIKNELPDLLNDPKYKWLADSIPQAPNRLQRAAQVYEIITSKKGPMQEKAPDRSNTPRSPQSVAKTNKLSLADRIMTMSDQELEDWRVG